MNPNSKKALEAILVGGVLVVSLNASAQTGACTGGTGVGIPSDPTAFVKTSFVPKCSANVNAVYLDSGAAFSVAGYSAKGNQSYGGSSEGGSVSMCTTFGVGAAPTLSPSTTSGCS
ncbi:MAG TPA: hypothetical protein VNZ68_04395 [Rhodocyclaceae bacterium]|nr:hypothetical protein [Rhodocyclaceae bacterium]